MESTFAWLVGNRHRGGRSSRDARSIPGHHRLAVLLIAFLLGLMSREIALPPAASAGGAEHRLLSITKTTVYGAILGGILGLASALVVREGYEDDAIRWGVAVGAFSGFIYGALGSEDSDDFSLDPRPESRRLADFGLGGGGEAAGLGRAAGRGGARPATRRSPAIGAPLSLDHAWNEPPDGTTAAGFHGLWTNQER